MAESSQIEDIKKLIVQHLDALLTCDAPTVGRNGINKYGYAIALETAFINQEASDSIKSTLSLLSSEWTRQRMEFMRYYKPGDFEDSIEETIRMNKNRAQLNKWYQEEAGEHINKILTGYKVLQ